VVSQQYFNPYTGKGFFGFLWELMVRFWAFLTGNLPIDDLASDEIQVLVLIGVSASSALVGTFLILRKMTMLANSLSHTILVGIVLAYLMTQSTFAHGHAEPLNIQAMLIASLITGLLTAFLTELLTKGAKLQEDASTGIVFTSMFAIGIIAVTVLTRNVHIGTEVVMGNVDALQLADCKLVYSVLALNIVLFSLFFKEYKITTFDAGLARSFGISPTFFNYLLMTQVSATAIGAFRAVGVLLVLSFITGPALTARLLTHDLKKMLALSVFLGCLASVIGVAISRHMLSFYGMAISTGGVVVCVKILIFFSAAAYTHRHTLFRLAQKNFKLSRSGDTS
jgi:manganese/zinc/iron transport system permease protein